MFGFGVSKDEAIVFVQRWTELENAAAKLKLGYYTNYDRDDYQNHILARRKRKCKMPGMMWKESKNDAWWCCKRQKEDDAWWQSQSKDDARRKGKAKNNGMISKSKEPGLAALAKKAPDVVKKMGKDPNDIKMMRRRVVGHGKVGGCNTNVQMSGLKTG